VKKKELVGDFKTTAGSAARKAIFEEVRVHDFLIKKLGRAVPYGIYDLAAMLAGSVSASTTTRRHSPCRRSAVGGTPLSDAENLFRQPEQAQCTPVDILREPAIARQTTPRPDAVCVSMCRPLRHEVGELASEYRPNADAEICKPQLMA
jgi:hypothetical protein